MNHILVLLMGAAMIVLGATHDLTDEKDKLRLVLKTNVQIKGNLVVVLYTNAADFLTEKGTVLKAQAVAEETLTFETESLAKGTYALVVFEDLNNNGLLDQNKLGIPQEPFGFSKAKLGIFGPPSFNKASFNFPEESKIEVVLKAF